VTCLEFNGAKKSRNSIGIVKPSFKCIVKTCDEIPIREEKRVLFKSKEKTHQKPEKREEEEEERSLLFIRILELGFVDFR